MSADIQQKPSWSWRGAFSLICAHARDTASDLACAAEQAGWDDYAGEVIVLRIYLMADGLGGATAALVVRDRVAAGG